MCLSSLTLAYCDATTTGEIANIAFVKKRAELWKGKKTRSELTQARDRLSRQKRRKVETNGSNIRIDVTVTHEAHAWKSLNQGPSFLPSSTIFLFSLSSFLFVLPLRSAYPIRDEIRFGRKEEHEAEKEQEKKLSFLTYGEI